MQISTRSPLCLFHRVYFYTRKTRLKSSFAKTGNGIYAKLHLQFYRSVWQAGQWCRAWSEAANEWRLFTSRLTFVSASPLPGSCPPRNGFQRKTTRRFSSSSRFVSNSLQRRGEKRRIGNFLKLGIILFLQQVCTPVKFESVIIQILFFENRGKEIGNSENIAFNNAVKIISSGKNTRLKEFSRTCLIYTQLFTSLCSETLRWNGKRGGKRGGRGVIHESGAL